MIKNLKKLFATILALTFSLSCVINIPTFASDLMPLDYSYDCFEYPYFPSYDCNDIDSLVPLDDSTYHDGYSAESYFHLCDCNHINSLVPLDDSTYTVDYSVEPYFSSYDCKYNASFVSFDDGTHHLDYFKAPCFSWTDCKNEYKSCSSLEEISSMCINLYKLIQDEQTYTKACIDTSDYFSSYNIDLMNTTLNVTQTSSVFNVLSYLQKFGHQNFDYVNFFSKKPSLNLFDAIFVYSYICNTVSPEDERIYSEIQRILMDYDLCQIFGPMETNPDYSRLACDPY